MENRKRPNRFQRIILVVLFLGVIIGVLGGNQVFIGSSLNFLRPFYFFLCGCLACLFLKRSFSKFYTYIFIFSIMILLGETVFYWLSKKSLNTIKGDNEITVLSYNLLFNNRRKGQAMKLIKEANTDVVMVQEMTDEWHSKLLAVLTSKYPYRYLYPNRGVRGLGVFSKFPLVKKSYVFNDSRKPLAQIVNLNLNGTAITLANVHFASPAVALEDPDNFLSLYLVNYETRELQWSRLMNEIRDNGAPNVVIAGDFNTMPIEPLYQKITSDFVDADDDFLWLRSSTFPNVADKEAFLPLDYFFLKGNLSVHDFEVIPGGSSDHLAIKTTLKY